MDRIVKKPYKGIEDGLGLPERQADSARRKSVQPKPADQLQALTAEFQGKDELFRKMLEIETVGIIFFDPSGTIFRVNDAFLRMSGYTHDDVAAGKLRWDRLTPPEWMAASRRAIAQLQTLGSTTPYEKQYYCKDGSRFWGLFAAKGLSEREGVEFILDITERKRLEEELHRAYQQQSTIAQLLQDAIRPVLPEQQPSGLEVQAFYRPALEEASVGGDFYDVFALDADRHALVVADLSGKGVTAAAQIATVRHMLRALLYQQCQQKEQPMLLGKTVSSLNAMLTEHGLLSGFATLFVGVFDSTQRTLNYVNAGQEPGLLLRATTGAVEELGPTGPILGAIPGMVFDEQTVNLATSDVVALFTDGLTEAGCNRKDMLGMSGVTTIFQASAAHTDCPMAIITQMIASVESTATLAGLRDDVSLLVARVE